MKNPTIEQIETTNKAYFIRQNIDNDCELAELFGLSKVTLYTRLKNHNWKKSEIFFIDNIYNFYKNK
jgi:hypothetical protein